MAPINSHGHRLMTRRASPPSFTSFDPLRIEAGRVIDCGVAGHFQARDRIDRTSDILLCGTPG